MNFKSNVTNFEEVLSFERFDVVLLELDVP